MVVKRQCSFCAGEVEPGTGTMFVKRDGTVYYFCSSSCRKQQLHLGRVGHRLKWTRAHAVKRVQAQSTAQRSSRVVAAASTAAAARTKPVAPSVPAPAPAAPAAPATEPEAATAAAPPAKEEPPAQEAPAKEKPAPKSRAKPGGGGAKSKSSKPTATSDKT